MRQFDITSLVDEARTCDICIVGSGPAGVAIARELSGGDLAITIVESGDFTRNNSADALNEVENIGYQRVEDQWLVRNRIVGGSSHTWSGRCVPFDSIDYERREWVPDSGWPIPQSELATYLDRAAVPLGITVGSGYGEENFWSLAGRKRPLPAFDKRSLDSYFWAFSKDPDNPREHMRFGWHLQSWLRDNVTLITNATACRVNMETGGRVARSVQVAAPDGARHNIAARVIVLCAGGIENPRLLLCSGEAGSAPGNASDLVGRFLMDHLRGEVGTFSLSGTNGLRKQFGHYRFRDGQVFAHGMQMSPELQRNERLLNCTAWLEGRITTDDPYNALKRWLRLKPQLPVDATTIFANLGLLAIGIWDYYVSRNGLRRKIERLSLVAMCEQLPDRESRVTLSNARDCFGVPKARIDRRVHRQEVQTLRRMAQLVAKEFARLKLAEPDLADWVLDNGALPAEFKDVAHPTGTTRMGDRPDNSVVDCDCKVHGTENLYVAGSSVFPTSSHANPTQMILALAIRLADHLKENTTLHPVPITEAGFV